MLMTTPWTVYVVCGLAFHSLLELVIPIGLWGLQSRLILLNFDGIFFSHLIFSSLLYMLSFSRKYSDHIAGDTCTSIVSLCKCDKFTLRYHLCLLQQPSAGQPQLTSCHSPPFPLKTASSSCCDSIYTTIYTLHCSRLPLSSKKCIPSLWTI